MDLGVDDDVLLAEHKRRHTAAKRAAKAAGLERRRDCKRARREGERALAAAGPNAVAAAAEEAVVTYAELAAGLGSARAALEILRPAPRCIGWNVRSVHASDISGDKVQMYNAISAAAEAAAAAAATAAGAAPAASKAAAAAAVSARPRSAAGAPAAGNGPLPPPPAAPPHAEVADVTDKAHFTPKRVASWGRLVVLVASIVCKSLSPIGKREGLAKIGAYLRGLWRIIKLSEPEIFVSECVPGLEKDPLFKKKVLGPLRKLGYGCSYECIDARAYTSCARNRIFLVCFRDKAAQERFAFPAEPDRRAAHLYPLLLPAYSKSAPAGARQAPLASYCAARAVGAMKIRVKKAKEEEATAAAAAKPAGKVAAAAAAVAAAPAAASAPAKKATRPPRVLQKDWSIAAREVKKLPFLRGRLHSRIVNFQYGRVNASKTGRAMAPTLVWSPSGGYMVKDAHGPRMLVASEVAPLFGFSAAEADAAVAAVGGSSTKVVSALGDSIVVFVLRDVLRAALRAREPPRGAE